MRTKSCDDLYAEVEDLEDRIALLGSSVAILAYNSGTYQALRGDVVLCDGHVTNDAAEVVQHDPHEPFECQRGSIVGDDVAFEYCVCERCGTVWIVDMENDDDR